MVGSAVYVGNSRVATGVAAGGGWVIVGMMMVESDSVGLGEDGKDKVEDGSDEGMEVSDVDDVDAMMDGSIEVSVVGSGSGDELVLNVVEDVKVTTGVSGAKTVVISGVVDVTVVIFVSETVSWVVEVVVTTGGSRCDSVDATSSVVVWKFEGGKVVVDKREDTGLSSDCVGFGNIIEDVKVTTGVSGAKPVVISGVVDVTVVFFVSETVSWVVERVVTTGGSRCDSVEVTSSVVVRKVGGRKVVVDIKGVSDLSKDCVGSGVVVIEVTILAKGGKGFLYFVFGKVNE
jgi:hypothetical protein